MLRALAGVHPRHVRKGDVALDHFGKEKFVQPRAEGLDPAQPRRGLEYGFGEVPEQHLRISCQADRVLLGFRVDHFRVGHDRSEPLDLLIREVEVYQDFHGDSVSDCQNVLSQRRKDRKGFHGVMLCAFATFASLQEMKRCFGLCR